MIVYKIYSNDGAGGPVNYGVVVATTSSLAWTSAPLAAGADATFAVRAYDNVSLLEDRNTDARVRVLVGASGEDLTGLPNAPANMTARPTAGGTALVEWTYNDAGQGGAPAGFRVYAGTPAVSYVTPVATVPYGDARMHYRATLSGLTDGAPYQISVRSYNASGEEANATVAALAASSTGPDPVDGLAGVAVSA